MSAFGIFGHEDDLYAIPISIAAPALAHNLNFFSS